MNMEELNVEALSLLVNHTDNYVAGSLKLVEEHLLPITEYGTKAGVPSKILAEANAVIICKGLMVTLHPILDSLEEKGLMEEREVFLRHLADVIKHFWPDQVEEYEQEVPK